jgi:hypothetical protein
MHKVKRYGQNNATECLVKYKGFQSILILYQDAYIWRVISDSASRNNFAPIKTQLKMSKAVNYTGYSYIGIMQYNARFVDHRN